MAKPKHMLVFVSMASALGGCGLLLPDLQPFGESKDRERADENVIVNQMKCELRKGVQQTLNDPFFKTPGPLAGNSVDWLDTWAATVALDLTVEEQSALGPGISLTEPFPAPSKASRGLSIGVQASTDATHKETMSFTYSFAALNAAPAPPGPCADENGVLIHSDLKIVDFIQNKAFVARIPGSLPPSGFNGFSYEATFKVMHSGNVTPSWKFVRLSVNPSGSLLSATQTRTQHVLLTVGPAGSGTPKIAPNQPATLAAQPQALHDAGLIGHAVSTAIQGLISPP
jgi:hypothetical protein